MSQAVLDHRPGWHPDVARIVALSAAISLNAAMLLLALRPLPLRLVASPVQATPIRLIAVRPLPPAPPQPPAPPPLHPRNVPEPRPVPMRMPQPQVQPSPMSLPAPSLPDPAPPPVVPVTPAPTSAPPGPVQARLAYLSAPPPRYPMAARRAGMQGTVTLRVLVDVNGRPREVAVARSSGHPLLDRTARRKVLRDWRFVPARIHGRPTPAWALVPVVFHLDQP